MKLRNVFFGYVFNAAGARNFFGNGYWFHKILAWLGLLSFFGSTLITKTVTLNAVTGNMPLESDGVTPKERLPKCIIVKPFKGVALNAVGLSNFGAEHYFKLRFENERWQDRKEPFLISFMAVSKTRDERLKEAIAFFELLVEELPYFKATVGLQLNFSCPNVGHEQKELLSEAESFLDLFSLLKIPIVIKLNALSSIESVLKLEQHPALDAISVSNTIPWGELPAEIDWKGLFGSDESPLAKRFKNPNIKGGLSGKPLLRIVEGWIKEARHAGFKKPIMGGGGILSKSDAKRLIKAGANAIELGSVAFLRPWRVKGIIKHVNQQLGASQ